MLDVLFICSTDSLELRNEVNGTMLLATKLLQAGFSTKILRFGESKDYWKKDYDLFIADMTDRIIKKDPKCLSFYTLWPYYHTMLRIALEVKKKNPCIITVLGGPQASASAEETLLAMPQIDYICTGEGENTVVPFISAVLSNNTDGLSEIPSLWYRKDGKVCFNALEHPLCNLNTLPYWDERLYRDVLEKENYGSPKYFMPIDVGRGCPYSCTFCSTKDFWRRTYRLKTPERIIEEILYYYNKFGIRSFLFSHDAFTANQKLVDAVCDKILEAQLDIQWKCTTRIDCISKELILKMKKAGLTSISLGVETGSTRMQKLINKRLNLSVVREMTQFLIDNGIEVCHYFMYGFPDETEEDLNETLELYFDLTDMGTNDAAMSFCCFTAQTEITNKCFDDLVLDPDIKIIFRGIFGAAEEMDTIQKNKSIFTHFYHLHTQVRDDYPYIFVFARTYQKLPLTMGLLRQTFDKDNLKFYRIFIESNSHIFDKGMAEIMRVFIRTPHELVQNMLKGMDPEDALLFESILKCETR